MYGVLSVFCCKGAELDAGLRDATTIGTGDGEEVVAYANLFVELGKVPQAVGNMAADGGHATLALNFAECGQGFLQIKENETNLVPIRLGPGGNRFK